MALVIGWSAFSAILSMGVIIVLGFKAIME